MLASALGVLVCRLAFADGLDSLSVNVSFGFVAIVSSVTRTDT